MRCTPKACWPSVLSLHLQRCARVEGVWDDSNNVWEGGGSCISQQEAAQKLLDDPAGLEQIALQLSNDGHLASFSSEGLPVAAHIGWALLSSSLGHYCSFCQFAVLLNISVAALDPLNTQVLWLCNCRIKALALLAAEIAHQLLSAS